MALDGQDDLEMVLEYDDYDLDESHRSETESGSGEDDGELGEDDNSGDDADGVDEQAAGMIAPYQYEPLPRERGEDEEENLGDARIIDPTRLNRNDW